MYHLHTFRDLVKITQAEMAEKLGVNVSTYAMMERGKRKVPKALYPAMQRLLDKYELRLDQVQLIEIKESPIVNTLREKIERESVEDLRLHVVKCGVQISDLTKELKRMKKGFNKALELLNSAEAQLPALEGKAEGRFSFDKLTFQKHKAIETMNRISQKNPLKIAMQIKALTYEKQLVTEAAEEASLHWLEFADKMKLIE